MRLRTLSGRSSARLCSAGEDLLQRLTVWPELAFLPSLPFSAQLRIAQVPVGTDLLCDLTQIVVEVGNRRSTPVPVAVVDAEDLELLLQDQRVRNHRIVQRIGVFLDVQIL